MSTESTRPPARRPYRKRRRAEQERRTRGRITEAAVKLHGTIGPARTTFSGVAEEAGVQRATVYRHFPDEASLFAACSAHYAAANPPPEPGKWSSIADLRARLRRALADVYAFYRRTEPMMENVVRDAPMVESLAGSMEAFAAYMKAAIGHAISFFTWRSLVREQGLADAEAVAVMAAMVDAAGGARPAKS